MDPQAIAVLIVEDNPGDARLIQEELKDAGGAFMTEHAESLARALEKLSKHPFDIVLLDLSLPDSQGVETVERLEGEAPDLPIVVLTGLEDQKTAMQAVRAGAQDYLVKGTVDGDRLSRAMRYAIERRQVTREVQDLRQQLAMSEKLSTLGALVSGIASELRTSTTYITNTLFQIRQSIEKAASEHEELAEVAGDVNDRMVRAMEGIDRIDRLVRELRGFTSRGGKDAEPVGLDVPVAEAVEVFRTTHRSKVSVVSDVEEAEPMPLDAVQVQQVVLNLLSNASDAMPDGGTVRVRVRPAAGGAELVIADEGTGLSPDARRRLFEPFFTTKPGSPGLGLAIAQRIVDAHGGTIKVDSQPGRGTTFTVFFPRRRQESEPEVAAEG